MCYCFIRRGKYGLPKSRITASTKNVDNRFDAAVSQHNESFRFAGSLIHSFHRWFGYSITISDVFPGCFRSPFVFCIFTYTSSQTWSKASFCSNHTSRAQWPRCRAYVSLQSIVSAAMVTASLHANKGASTQSHSDGNTAGLGLSALRTGCFPHLPNWFHSGKKGNAST